MIKIKRIEKEERKPEDKLEHIEDIYLKCNSCEKNIVLIKVVKETEASQDFQAICNCKGMSFVKEVFGNVYVASVDPFKIKDVTDDNGITIIEVL